MHYGSKRTVAAQFKRSLCFGLLGLLAGMMSAWSVFHPKTAIGQWDGKAAPLLQSLPLPLANALVVASFAGIAIYCVLTLIRRNDGRPNSAIGEYSCVASIGLFHTRTMRWENIEHVRMFGQFIEPSS